MTSKDYADDHLITADSQEADEYGKTIVKDLITFLKKAYNSGEKIKQVSVLMIIYISMGHMLKLPNH